MKNIREKTRKLKEYVSHHRRYTFDKDQLIYRKESPISTTTIILLFAVLSLIYVINLQNVKLKEVHELSSRHSDTIESLMTEVACKKFSEGEYQLFTEIGRVMTEKNTEPCNEKSVCEYIDRLAEMGIVWYPEIIKSTCQVESGFGASNVAKKYNNLFGMDHPRVRQTLSTHQSGGRFSTFKNWKCSVLDRVLWDYATFNDKVPEREEYLQKINTKYNTENPNYINKVLGCSVNF